MKVYKFGGASVRNAAGIKNLGIIVSGVKENLVVVVSAFGKTTNALENVLKAWINGDEKHSSLLDKVYKEHLLIIEELFLDKARVSGEIDISFGQLKEFISSKKSINYDFDYDQIVSFGEIWSSIIVSEYLKTKSVGVEWIDIRENLLTDKRFRDANILWNESADRIRVAFNFLKTGIYVTQGFIGGTVEKESTTLGREGSDYTAAVLANMLDAESVTVWKDVPGILNADPKWMNDALKLDEISYREAVEISFSGAKVIHPKTIKPLHNKNIPLHVKSFINPPEPGTVIKADAAIRRAVPVYIKKEDQILISIVPKDLSFVMGDNLAHIFHSFMAHGIKVNLVEASAISLDVCVDDERQKVDTLIHDLSSDFSTVYNEKVELLSVRHYTPGAVKKITEGREILLEQRTRSTVRFVVRKEPSNFL
jgi:aspartate kinase